MPIDPLSAAGLGLGAVSLAIQVADGLRKGFIFIENAARADEDTRAFALSLTIEHQRFETWSDLSGLVVARGQHEGDEEQIRQKAKNDFERLIKYSGSVIVPTLLEMNTAMSQLSDYANRYSEFIDASSYVGRDEADTVDEVTDITDHQQAHISSSLRTVQSLSVSIQAKKRPATRGDVTESHATKSFFGGIFTRILKSGKKASNPKSVRWVIHDAEACWKRITRVHDLNAFLRESLSHVTQEKQLERDALFHSMLVRVENNSRAMLLALADVHSAGSSAGSSTVSGSTVVEHQLRSDFARQAARFTLEVLDQTARSDALVRIDAEEVSSFEFLDELEGEFRQDVKRADGSRCWVEWRTYTEENLAKRYEPPLLGLPPDLPKKMDRLVSLLKLETKPRQFCVPPCLGYFIDEDECRIGMMYEPPAESVGQRPTSLFTCLDGEKMSLSNRVHIAKTLAQWLLHLHSVRWLHKGIESASVLFFQRDGTLDLESPYITGFSYARTASTDPSKGTTKPPYAKPRVYYVHPEYQDPDNAGRYHEIYDIYSLGIILVELAYWQPIETILRAYLNPSLANSPATGGAERRRSNVSGAVTNRATQQQPLDAGIEGEKLVRGRHPVLEHVRVLVGEKYYNATRACLQGLPALAPVEGEFESNAELSTYLLEAFGRDVVGPLSTVVV